MDDGRLQTLSFLREVCHRFALAPLVARVSDAIAYSSQADQVDVVVLGRFKSGKSSLLNALLGRDVLPVDVLPATAVVTRLAPGSVDRATIVGEDGTERPVDLQDLPRYVTEKENPDNAQRVARVEVELAEAQILAGLRLVDTPGMGSIHRHNTEVTEHWLPQVGAALLAISVDQPLSEHDLALIEELRSFTPLVTIVLTKADLVEPDQLRAVEEYVRRETQGRLGRAVEVIPVSVRPGHEGRLERLRRRLAAELAGDRSHAAEAILAHKLRVLVDACRDYLGVALQAARAGAQVRAELRAEIEEERHNIGLIDKELSLISGSVRQEALNATERRFLSHRGEMARDLRSELLREAPRWRGNLAREARAFREWLGSALESRLTQVSGEEQGAWGALVQEADVAVNRVVRAFQDRLSEKVRQALGIAFAGAAFEVRPQAPQRPSLSLSRVFDTHVDVLWFLIPMTLLRPLFRRHFRMSVAWEVEKHLYRLASQWSEAIGMAIETIVTVARDHIRGELDMLTDLVSRSIDDSGEIESAVAHLARLRSVAPREGAGAAADAAPSRHEQS
jgi:GTP-binding protein EngB required for normal cell division